MILLRIPRNDRQLQSLRPLMMIISFYRRTDPEIAEAVINVLKWSSTVPDEKIMVKVEEGVVSLAGEMEWDYQRTAARKPDRYPASVFWKQQFK
jgi:osmotically-inducible protein OsmY